MTTNRVIRYKSINTKMGTIKRLVVFILVFIFIYVLMNTIMYRTAYADPTNETSTDKENFVTVGNDKVIEESNGKLSVKIRCGINGTAKLYETIAVNVEITNNGPEFEGYVQVGIPQSKEGTLYAEKILLKESATTSIDLYLPVNIQTDILKFEITDSKKKSCLKSDVAVTTYMQNKFMVGILADNASPLVYLLANKDSRYYFYDTSTIPEDCRELDVLDILVINNYNVGRLSANQYNAIKEWVLSGGTLVIGTGSGAGSVLNTFSKDFLEVKTSEVESMKISFGENESNKQEKYNYIETDVASIELEDAITIESASSRPIIQSVNKGKGKVIVCGFNLRIPNTYEQMQQKLSDIVYTYSAVESDMMYSKFLKSILESAKGKTPNRLVYILILGLYVVLLSVAVIVLSKKLNTSMVIKIVPILAAIMCIVIAIIGSGTRIKNMHSSHFSLLNLEGNGIVNVEKYYNITLPNSRERKLELKEQNHVLELAETGSDAKVSSGVDFNTEITREGEVTGINLKGVAAFDTKTFESIGKYESKMVLNASINCWEESYSGTVDNSTGFDLDHVFLVTKSTIVYVGDIPKDEKKNADGMKKVNYVSINDFETLVPPILGEKVKNTNSINSKGEITASGITRILQYYMISNGVPASNEGYLLAITRSGDKTFVNNNIEEEGISVITSVVPVNYVSGSKEYISNICKENISYELGNYYYSTTTNTIQLTDNVVAEYRLNSSKKFDSLTIYGESKDSTKAYFNGNVSFWNYTSKEYEKVFQSSDNRDINITDMTKYISSSGILKMKFEVNEGGSGCTLPIISAIISQ